MAADKAGATAEDNVIEPTRDEGIIMSVGDNKGAPSALAILAEFGATRQPNSSEISMFARRQLINKPLVIPLCVRGSEMERIYYSLFYMSSM